MSTDDDLLKAMRDAEQAILEGQKSDQIYGVRGGSPPIASWPTSPCRIVFLDFDGVLNSAKSVQELGTQYRLSRVNISALNRLLIQSGALIVITSSWRQQWSLRENATTLEKSGVVAGRVVGKTPILAGERGLEIDSWLRSVPFPIESFMILDDHDDMAMHGGRLVQTNPAFGLDDRDVGRALGMLMG
jgi:hypothetical protein